MHYFDFLVWEPRKHSMSILHLDVTPVPAPVHLANELYQQSNTNKPKRVEFLNSVQKAWHPPNSTQKKNQARDHSQIKK